MTTSRGSLAARLRRWLALASLSIGSVVATLVAVEVALQIFDLYGPASRHVMPPGRDLPDVQTEWDLTYHVNALGLRGERVPYERPADVQQRIVVIGDSFTFGQGVEEEQSFPAVLESMLRERGKRVEVINVSNIGIGPEAYYVLLREIGLRYDPDVVVLNVYGNDAAGGFPDSWVRGAVRRLSQDLHLFALVRLVNKQRGQRRNAAVTADPETYWSRLRDDCRAHHPAAECERIEREFRERHGSRINNLATGCLTEPEKILRSVEPDPAGQGWRYLASYVEKMAALCERRSCRLVLGIVPEGVQVDPRQLALHRSLGVSHPERVLTGPGRFQGLVTALAERLGLGSFDPLPAFRDAPGPLYFEADSHWTPAGHALYARELLRFLVEEGYVE